MTAPVDSYIKPIILNLSALKALMLTSRTVHTLARDHEGEPCEVGAAKACMFCLIGGVMKVTQVDEEAWLREPEAIELISKLYEQLPANYKYTKSAGTDWNWTDIDKRYRLEAFNDSQPAAEVISLIQAAVNQELDHA